MAFAGSSPLDSTNGNAASGAAPIIDAIAPEPAGSPREPDDATMRPAALDVPEARAMLRVGALAIVAFEIGYTVLDRVEYPQTLARTLPLHVAIVAFGVAALVLTLSPRAMRNWQALTLLILASIMAATASIALINSDSDVLVASLAMFFFAAGTLLPWNAALASGARGDWGARVAGVLVREPRTPIRVSGSHGWCSRARRYGRN